jgi:hypothetical protein
MALRSSEITATDIGNEFTEYEAQGLKFTYHRRLNRLVLDDGSAGVYTTVKTKVEAKQAVLRYCTTGTFSID